MSSRLPALFSQANQGRRLPAAGQEQAAEFEGLWPEIAGAAATLRSRQSICGRLYVVHDRYRLQRREDQAAPRRQADNDSWEHVLQAGEFEKIRRLRRLCDRQSRRFFSHHAQLFQTRSQFEKLPRTSGARRICSQLRRISRNSTHQNISTRSPMATSVSRSAGRAILIRPATRAKEANNGVEIDYEFRRRAR